MSRHEPREGIAISEAHQGLTDHSIYTVTKTIAAYMLADAKSWKQGHADETSRRQTSLLNFLMGLVTKDDKFKAVCIDLAIIAKNGSAEEQSRAVLSALRDCKTLLE